MLERQPSIQTNTDERDTRYLFILKKFLTHWYEQKQVSRKYSSEEVFQQFMKDYDWEMQFIGPHLHN